MEMNNAELLQMYIETTCPVISSSRQEDTQTSSSTSYLGMSSATEPSFCCFSRAVSEPTYSSYSCQMKMRAYYSSPEQPAPPLAGLSGMGSAIAHLSSSSGHIESNRTVIYMTRLYSIYNTTSPTLLKKQVYPQIPYLHFYSSCPPTDYVIKS